MAILWNLKRWLAVERDIYRPSELQARIAERTGYYLSLPAVSALMNRTPDGLRLRTIQALCRSLDCRLSDFFDITPEGVSESQARDQGTAQRYQQAPGKKNRISQQRRVSIVFPELPRSSEDTADV